MLAPAMLLVGAGACAWCLARRRRPRPVVHGTLVDAPTAQRVEDLVRLVDRHDGADALAERVERLLTTFAPTERTLRRLSLQQQALQGAGNSLEYSVALVYVVSMQCAASATRRPRRRRHSWPS